MNLLYFVDGLLIEKVFQPIADWFAEWTGKSHCYFALPFIIWSILANILIGYYIMALAFSIVLANAFNRARAATAREFVNPLRRDLFGLRIVFLILLDIFTFFTIIFPINLRQMIMLSLHFSMVSSLYLLSCQSNPPAKSRLSKLADKIRETWSADPMPEGAPA